MSLFNKQTTPPEDRTAYLRQMLDFPMTKDDLIPAVREIARLMIAFNADLSTLSEMRNILATMQKLQIEFMEDQLSYRQKREEADLHAASAKAEQVKEDVNRTSQKIKALRLTGSTGVPILSAKQGTWDWWRDRVFAPVMSNLLGWMTLGIAGFIAYAIFMAIKAALVAVK